MTIAFPKPIREPAVELKMIARLLRQGRISDEDARRRVLRIHRRIVARDGGR